MANLKQGDDTPDLFPPVSGLWHPWQAADVVTPKLSPRDLKCKLTVQTTNPKTSGYQEGEGESMAGDRCKLVVKNTFWQLQHRRIKRWHSPNSSDSECSTPKHRASSDSGLHESGKSAGLSEADLTKLAGNALDALSEVEGDAVWTPCPSREEDETASNVTDGAWTVDEDAVPQPKVSIAASSATTAGDSVASENARLVQENARLRQQSMECENARLAMENTLLKEQVLAIASAAHSAAIAAEMAACASLSTNPMDASASSLAQQATYLRTVARTALLAGAKPEGNGASMQPAQLLAMMQNVLAMKSQMQSGGSLEIPSVVPEAPKKIGARHASQNSKSGTCARAVDKTVASVAMTPCGTLGNNATSVQHESLSYLREGPVEFQAALHAEPADIRTTVMLRNLPNQYKRDMLLDLLDGEGFAGLYDFAYVPVDFKSKCSLGYAFIDLVDHDVARRFFSKLHGFCKWVIPSRKTCEVAWSGPHQGLPAHIERYRNSPVMHESVPDIYKPAIFKDGERLPFPPPNKKLRAPRVQTEKKGVALDKNGVGIATV